MYTYVYLFDLKGKYFRYTKCIKGIQKVSVLPHLIKVSRSKDWKEWQIIVINFTLLLKLGKK